MPDAKPAASEEQRFVDALRNLGDAGAGGQSFDVNPERLAHVLIDMQQEKIANLTARIDQEVARAQAWREIAEERLLILSTAGMVGSMEKIALAQKKLEELDDAT